MPGSSAMVWHQWHYHWMAGKLPEVRTNSLQLTTVSVQTCIKYLVFLKELYRFGLGCSCVMALSKGTMASIVLHSYMNL